MAILIDNTPPEDGRRSLKSQVSDINRAQEYLYGNKDGSIKGQNSILQGKVQDYSQSSNELKKNLDDFNNAIKILKNNLSSLDKNSQQNFKDFLSTIGLTQKKLDGYSLEYDKTIQALKKLNDGTAVTGEQLIDTINAYEDMTEQLGDTAGILKKINTNFNSLNDSVKEEIKIKVNANRINAEEARQAREQNKTEYLYNQKVAAQSINKAVKEEIGKLGDTLSQLANTLNINRIAQSVAVSAKQQLQGELQTNYNLSGREFEKFKHDLYNQIDTSIYSNEEVVAAMQTLNTTALGNTQTATKYFNDIIRGQKVLGISSEAQQQLLKLGNITGRNELSFYQGTVAKFLNSSLGLNKQQLNELVKMNASTAELASDFGITSEAFQRTNLIETAAIEKTRTGMAQNLSTANQTLLTSDEDLASFLGMNIGKYAELREKGVGLTDLILNASSATGAGQALQAYRTGNTEQIANLRTYAMNAWGVNGDAVLQVVKTLATQQEEFTSNLQTATQASNEELEKTLEELTNKEMEPINAIQEAVNRIANWFDSTIPWTFGSTLTSIVVGISTIISLMRINGNLKEILGGISGKGVATGWLSASSGASSLLGGTLSNGAALGAVGGIAGGGIMGIIDAFKMQGSTGKGWALDALRGFGLGTGSLEKSSGQNAMSVGANSLKWGAIGAGIGTLIAPGVGSVIGGAVGALGGVVAGLWGTTKENKKLQEEQNEKLKEIETNTDKTAKNTARDNIGIVYRYRGTDNYSSMGAIGSTSGGSYTGYIAKGPIGAMEDAGKPITSYWRQKRTYKDTKGVWHTDIHNGADFYVPEGTPLYSNATGTVTMNLTEKSGANIVGVTDAQGYTHLYAHMQSKSPLKVGTTVNKGQFVGYSGKTGKVTGPHLHYSVLKPGEDARRNYWVLNNTVDPGPFVSSSIFNGDSSSVISGANSMALTSGSAITDMLGKNSTMIKLASIGGISGPIVDSISDLKQTIVDLSTKTDRNEKILNMLTSKPIESPIL